MEIFYSKDIKDGRAELSPEESSHCVRVLRHREGDEILVAGGDGNLYRCLMEKADSSRAVLSVVSVEGGFGGHDYYLHMAVAPPKNNDRFEWFMEKATELGIDRITPLLCARSERRSFNRERGERIILSAAKQSLKGYLPKLDPLVPFTDLLSSSESFDGARFIAYCDRELYSEDGTPVRRIPLSEALMLSSGRTGSGRRALFLIGPEGDFSREEAAAAYKAGFIPVSLGNSRLRIETAAMLCVSAMYLY